MSLLMTASELYNKLKTLVKNGRGYRYDTKEIQEQSKKTGQAAGRIKCGRSNLLFFIKRELMEDNVLDKPDMITGYCNPNWRIWT